MISKEIIHKMVSSKQDGIDSAKEKINKWMEFPYTFKTVKRNIKRDAINKIDFILHANASNYLFEVSEYVLNPQAQEKFKKIYDILNRVK